MAGSLLRPPLNINPLTKKNNKNSNSNINIDSSSTSSISINNRAAEQHKFLIKKYQQRQHQSHCKQLQHLLQQQLKYCRQQSLLFKKLLLLLFAATNDSRRCCWTAIEKRKDCQSLKSATAKIWPIKYEQQQQQQQQKKQQQQHQQYIGQLQQLHLPNQQQQQEQHLLQLDNKVLAATKKIRKNLLLNRKKVEKLQLQLQLQLKKEFLFYREKKLLRKLNLF